ncbi:MAG: hypothetical protein GY853_14130 [PVC group bacterium]|nr:hypothetical protein [PVC group bacterium]
MCSSCDQKEKCDKKNKTELPNKYIKDVVGVFADWLKKEAPNMIKKGELNRRCYSINRSFKTKRQAMFYNPLKRDAEKFKGVSVHMLVEFDFEKIPKMEDE